MPTVAICGAGIGGLVCALSLAQLAPHVHVDIYERAPKLTELGAGIGIWPRPWTILQRLGIAQELRSKTMANINNGPAISFRKADQVPGYDLYALHSQGTGLVTLHRPDFQGVLLRALSKTSTRIHTSKKLTTYVANDMIELSFEDGSRAACNVLIGADGLQSTVRHTLVAQPTYSRSSHDLARPVWTGSVMYRALILLTSLPRTHRATSQFMQYVGHHGYVLAYPICTAANGPAVNFVAFTTDPSQEGSYLKGKHVEDVDPSILLSIFDGWEDDVRILCQCLADTRPRTIKWAIQTVLPLPSYVNGSVALLGDAAHAMTPHQGAGAGQAMEDAYLLSSLIARSIDDPSLIPRSLDIYDSIRRPKTQHVAQVSRLNGLRFVLCDNSNSDLVDTMHDASKAWEHVWMWNVGESPQDDVHRALRSLANTKSCIVS